MNRKRLHRLVAVLIVTVGLLAACGDDTTATTAAATTTSATTAPATTVPGGATISVSNFKFEPADVEITVGQTVTFSFVGGTHTATADDGSWSSGEKSAGGNFEVSFDQPGTYAFHCEIHASMQGTITVTE